MCEIEITTDMANCTFGPKIKVIGQNLVCVVQTNRGESNVIFFSACDFSGTAKFNNEALIHGQKLM